MPMSEYYVQLRKKVGTDLIFNPRVSAIIRNDKGEILFQRPTLTSTIWSLPAGVIEIGEVPAEAIVREVWEETGLRVKVKTLLGVFGGKDFRYTYPDSNQVEYIIIMFECTIIGGYLKAIEGESADIQFFHMDNIPKLALPYPKEIFYPSDSQRAFFQL